MARPSTELITKKNIIEQFHSLGIKTIINLQTPKEHANCGQPLESSGFSYDPNVFMENDIYHYNFAWKDYGDATLIGLLNMVKVVAFSVSEGNVAIHCHAGLGRTGVLIACYLIYSLRVDANQSIIYVRLKRPGSIQTRGQILCIRQFSNYIHSQMVVFFIKECEMEKHMKQFTLERYLKRQRVLLHGYEERKFKFIPKIVYVICERILKLCGRFTQEPTIPPNVPLTADFLCTKHGHQSMYNIQEYMSKLSPLYSDANSPSPLDGNSIKNISSPSSPSLSETSESFSDIFVDETESSLAENKCFQELQVQKTFENEPDDDIEIQEIESVVTALLSDFYSLDVTTQRAVRKIQQSINTSQCGWAMINAERDVCVLAGLLLEWLENLKIPILETDDMENVVVNYKQPDVCLSKMNLTSACLLEYLILFVIKLKPNNGAYKDKLLRRLLAALTHQTVKVEDHFVPTGRNFQALRNGTLSCSMEFLNALYTLIEQHHYNYASNISNSLENFYKQTVF